MNAGGWGWGGVNIHLIADEALDSRADCVMPAIILGDYCVAGGNNLVMFPRSGKEPSVPRRCARTAAAAGPREVLAPSAPGDSRLPVTAASR